MENIIMLILGVFISVVGIVNIKGNISTIICWQFLCSLQVNFMFFHWC